MRGFLVVAAAKLWKMQSKMMHQNGFSPAIGITHDRKKVKGLLSWYMAWLLGFVLLCLDNFRKCKARSKKKPLVLLLVADASRARQGGFGSSRWKRKQQGQGWKNKWGLVVQLFLMTAIRIGFDRKNDQVSICLCCFVVRPCLATLEFSFDRFWNAKQDEFFEWMRLICACWLGWLLLV